MKWWLSEKIANLLPKRVKVMVLFKLCIDDFGGNKNITLVSACKKYKSYVK